MDVRRLRVGRLVRCPKCRVSSQSMRISHYVCPACAHTWDVESRRGVFERVQDRLGEIGGGAFIGVLWLLSIKLVIAAFVALYLIFYRVTGSGGWAAAAASLIFLTILVYFALMSRGTIGRKLGRGPVEQYLRDDDERTDSHRRKF